MPVYIDYSDWDLHLWNLGVQRVCAEGVVSLVSKDFALSADMEAKVRSLQSSGKAYDFWFKFSTGVELLVKVSP